MAFNIDPNAPPLIQTTATPYGAPPSQAGAGDSQGSMPVIQSRSGVMHLPGGGSPFAAPRGAKSNGKGFGPGEMPPLDDYFKSRALTEKIPSLSSADDQTLAGYANDYASQFIPDAIQGQYQRKPDKAEIDAHVARFNMQFANDLPKFRDHFAKMENSGAAPAAPAGGTGLMSALGTHALGSAEQLGSEVGAGAPGMLANVPFSTAGGQILKMLAPDAVNKTQENIRKLVNPLVAPGVAELKKSGEENLAANPDVLKAHPILTKGAEIAGQVVPYAASTIAGPAGPVAVGGAQMGGSRLLAEQDRINALKPEELAALPEYQTLLKTTGDPEKAKQLLAKASSEAAEQVGEVGGALMGIVGGGGMTKPVQQVIANAIGKSTLKRVLATSVAEGGGFAGQQIAANAATTAATNKATGETREGDNLAGAEEQGIVGNVMGALGAILHSKVNPLKANPKAEGKPGAAEPKPGETPPPATAAGAPPVVKITNEQGKAYSEASQATLANPEYKPEPGAAPESALIPALEDFEGKLAASDVQFTPEQKSQAMAQFEQDWRKTHGVPEPAGPEAAAAPAVQESPAPTEAEAAAAVGGEPTPEAPAPETAAPPAAAEPETGMAPGEAREAAAEGAMSHGEAREAAPAAEPVPIRELVTRPGVDTRLPFGLTERVAQEFREKNGRDPTPEELNSHAKMVMDSVGVKSEYVTKREALGRLLEKDPTKIPTKQEIDEQALKMADPLKKDSAHAAVKDRIAEFDKPAREAQAAKEKADLERAKKENELMRQAREKSEADKASAEKAAADAAAAKEKEGIERGKKENELMRKNREESAAKRASDEKFRDVLKKTEPKKAEPEAAGEEVSANSRGPREEKGDVATTGRTVEDLRKALVAKLGERAVAALERTGVLKILQSRFDLERHEPGSIVPGDKRWATRGYFNGRTAYLLADHVPVGKEMGVLMHEVGVHYGLRYMLPKELFQSLKDYVRDSKNSAEINAAREKMEAGQPRENMKDEEIIAHMVEDNHEIKGSIWHKAWTAAKAFIYKHFGQHFSAETRQKLLDEDVIRSLVHGAARPQGMMKYSELGLREGAYSRSPTSIDDLEKAWRVKPEPTQSTPSPTHFEQTAFQKATTKVTNVLKPLMHYAESLVKAGKTIDPKADMYGAFTRLTGQKSHITDTQYHSVVEPIENKAVEIMNRLGIKDPEKFWDSVIRYIGAKHALEDNRRGELENVRLTDEAEAQRAPLKLALHKGELDPKDYMAKLKQIVNAPGARIEKNVPPLSGVPNALAHEAVARASKDVPADALEEMNEAFNPAREQHIQNGLENKTYTPNDVKVLRGYQSKYYLPNSGFADESLIPSAGSRPLGAFTKEAGFQSGRTTLGANPLDNFLSALRRSGEDIANNQATKAAYNAAIAKGNTLGAKIKTYNMESLVRDALAGGGKLSDVQKVFKDPNSIIHNDGKYRHVITYPEGSPVLEAMKKSQEPPDVGPLTKTVGRGTSLLARLYAGLNPSFAVATSLARDSTAYPTMLLADGKFAAAGAYVKNYLGFGGPFGAWKTFLGGKNIFNKSLGEIQDYAKENPDSFAHWYVDLSEHGGAFNFKDELQEVRKSQDLLDKVKEQSKNKLDPTTYWSTFKRFQDSIATGSLMIGRTSVYKSLVEGGMTKDKAAQYVKELTNFQQRSQTSDVLNHWFAFSRVGMASADRVAQFLKNDDGSFNYKKAAGLVALGTAFSSLSYQLLVNELGEDKAKKLTNDSLSRNFVIPNGTDKPYQIPMGLGLPRLMFGLGMMATRYARGHTDLKSAAESYKNTVMENLSPLHPVQPQEGASAATQAGDLLTAMIPTVARPVAESALNQSSFGNPITSEAGPGKFKSDSGRQSTPQQWKDLAQGIRSMGGPDMYPETLPYLINGYGGGALGMFLRSMKSQRLEELGKPQSLLEKTLPQFENRDIEFATSRDFYKDRDKLEDSTKQINALKADNKPVPMALQKQGDEAKKFEEASRQHGKEIKEVQNNHLLSTAAKNAKIAQINQQYQRTQEKLSREAERVNP